MAEVMANPKRTIALIAQKAAQGRFDEAATMAEQALLTDGDDPVLHALAGAIAFRRDAFAQAVPHLREAHRHFPDDLTVRANLADALHRTGDASAALALCDDRSVQNDRTLRLGRLGGHLAQEAEDFDLAQKLYRIVLSRNDSDWSAWNNLGNSLGALGQYDGAVEALRRAAALAPDSPPIQLNLGNVLIDAGHFDEGEGVLVAAAATFATDPAPLLALFGLYRLQGREDETYDAIAQAAARAPGVATIQCDWGQEAARRNLYQPAEGAFEAALILEPTLGPAYVGLAAVYERMNREGELDGLLDRAARHGVDERSASFINALRLKRAGDIEGAFAALEFAGDVVVAGRRLHLRGIMLDRLGRYDEAFAAFEDMNAFWREDPSRPLERAREYRDSVAQSEALLSKEWLAGWTPFVPKADHRSPIFLVGFPRSGTTLLDTMLMADPLVQVLEEEAFLAQIENDLGGFAALATADADQLEKARDRYFEKVAEVVDLKPDTIVVDKHPMHLNKVAVIRRLFPDARFLLALRHPCDVLLSCFLTNFRLNNAMANFIDLQDAATLYDMTFRNWEKSRETFALPVSTMVYERLVEDPERELKPIFATLGLSWPDDKLDHREAARARGTVGTASYAQVTEPIYKRASGRWQRYASHLKPICETIGPWVDRLGYSLTDDRIPSWADRVG
ncbi:tetratricopeptide repeat-containing sulfotransferase family protein [Sphingomonas sp.]|uniref:tetratricopeptide repeat-containing sulfotransferase family protein n=1 Tax=Sphingomonas sp. TaxID=28214 RepID=UPI0025E9F83B|nr:tetratricopeptide repeat-containing sulfotransferase family protein [Sphingomonas sp.]